MQTASDAVATSPPKVAFRIDATDATDVADFTDATLAVCPDLALSPDRRDAAASDAALPRVRAPAEATLRSVRTLDAASDAAPCVAPSSRTSAFSTVQYRSFSAPGRSTRSAVVSAMSRAVSVDAEFRIRLERVGPGVG